MSAISWDGTFLIRLPSQDLHEDFKNWLRPKPRWDPGVKAYRVPPLLQGMLDLESFSRSHGLSWDSEGVLAYRRLLGEALDRLERSSSLTAPPLDLELGLAPRPDQWAAIQYAKDAKRAIIADPPGVGKTLCALATAEALDAFPLLVTCTASNLLSMGSEVRKCLPRRTVSVVLRDREDYRSEVVVLSHDLLAPRLQALETIGFQGVVLDEAHKFKGRQSLRHKAARELCKPARMALGLTASPVVNLAVDLGSLFSCLGALDQFGGWKHFTERFAPPRPGFFGGVVYGNRDGPALGQMARMVGFMHRPLEALKPLLPKKQRCLVPVQGSEVGYGLTEKQVLEWLEQHPKQHRFGSAAKVTELRMLTGRSKVPAARSWVGDFLEGTAEKLVVFAWHQEVQRALAAAFPGCATVLGEDSPTFREEQRQLFQRKEGPQLLVASLKAGGESLDFTAARHALFAEIPWTPTELFQAEGRVYGRSNDEHGLTSTILFGLNTLDEHVWRVLTRKQGIAEAIVEGLTQEQVTRGVVASLQAK